MLKKLVAAVATLTVVAAMALSGAVFFRFVSDTVYEESTSHLAEIFHQANQTLYNMVSSNWNQMSMWVPYLEQACTDEAVVEYVEKAREEVQFTDFYFISRNGDYISADGTLGYLNLGSKLSSLIRDDEPVVVNSVVPGKPEIMVFAVPSGKSAFMGFEYEAIAITFNNSDMVESLKINTFDGLASTFAVLPDGRVVLNNSSTELKDVHNVIAFLRNEADFTDEQLDALKDDFLAGRSGDMEFSTNQDDYYLVYEPANFQDWTVLGIVSKGVVNAGMNRLQSLTLIVVSGISIVLGLTVITFMAVQNRQKLRQKNTELLSREELFSKLSANVDDVFVMLDAATLGVEYVSPNIEKLLGIPVNQVRSNVAVIQSLVKPGDNEQILDQLDTIKTGEQREWTREYLHAVTGEELWFRVVIFHTDINGDMKYIFDFSDRTKDERRNRELREAVAVAQNASRAKTTFLNNMSHDIRTPMNAIIGFTNIALKQHDPDEKDRCLEKIASSSEHLLTMINDVLDISRIESGNIKFMPLPVDIVEVSNAVLSIMSGFLSNRSITFNVNSDEPPTRYVLADAVRIREVLVNILGNAVKFTDDGGTITFCIDYLPGADERHMVVRYRIEDTGIGMSEEFVEHIFDEFSQEESSARTKYKGTGLGMAISKRYVDMMGGTIEVHSQKGVGSTFIVCIPVQVTDEADVQKTEVHDGPVDLQDVSILMAEDNDLNAEIATVQLEELGIRVVRASDGREAVRLFAENPPATFDIILMDIMMPEMNGYEATRAIRDMAARPDAAQIPILAMTANAFTEDVQTSMDAGMNGHLSKPMVMDELIKAIARNVSK